MNKIVILFITALLIISCNNQKKIIESFKIGVALPLNYDSYGIAPLNGIKLALDEINYTVGGVKIELVVRNTEADPKKGVDVMNEFNSMGINCILGEAASNVTLAMCPLANRYKIILFSPISSAQELTTNGGNYFFRLAPSDIDQSRIIANWIFEKTPKRVGILYVDNSWGQGLAYSVEKSLKEKGIKVFKSKVSSDDVTDFSTEILSLKRNNIDVLFSPLYPRSAGLAVKQVHEMDLDVPIFGADSWGSQEYIDGAGNYAEGSMFVVPGINSGIEYQNFIEKYKEIYNSQPNFNAASSYDCMKILICVFKELIDKKKELNSENIRGELYNIKFFGATGLSKFDKNGDVVGKEYTKKIIKNGKFDFAID